MPAITLIATRKSPLALLQTALVRTWLANALPDVTFEKLELSTKVDERLKWSLEKRGGIGLFTKELEDALIDARAELAVHSAKDMPTTSPTELAVAGYLPRARVEDVLVHRNGCPNPKTIATSSPRRRAQLAKRFPEAKWTTIRGNVGTRLRKIVEGGDQVEASVLAAAGLDRLSIEEHEGLTFEKLRIEEVVPAPGQGAIAIQCRSADLDRYTGLFCTKTELAVSLEKGFLRRLGSGCQIPVGAYFNEGTFHTFHPQTGYRAFSVKISSAVDIEPTLDKILNDLNL